MNDRLLSTHIDKQGRVVRELFLQCDNPGLDDAHAFVIDQHTHVITQVEEIEYPELMWSSLVPLNRDDGDNEWVPSITYFSSDMQGKMEIGTAQDDNMPVVSETMAKHEITVRMGKLGYRYHEEEVRLAMSLGRNLTARRAMACDRFAEEFVDRVALTGEAGVGTGKGLFNQTTRGQSGTDKTEIVLNTNAADQDWKSLAATDNGHKTIFRQINSDIIQVSVDTKGAAPANTMIVPLGILELLSEVIIPGTAENLYNYIMRNNAYTTKTGQPFSMVTHTELQTAGGSNATRSVIYRRDPSVLDMRMPMPYQLGTPWQVGHWTWEVPGRLRLTGLDVKRPLSIRYRDNV